MFKLHVFSSSSSNSSTKEMTFFSGRWKLLFILQFLHEKSKLVLFQMGMNQEIPKVTHVIKSFVLYKNFCVACEMGETYSELSINFDF